MDTNKILLMGDPQYGMSIPAHVVMKDDDIIVIDDATEKLHKVVGHLDHTRSTLQAAMTQMLIERANEPDMQNIGPEKSVTIELTNPYPPDITDRYVDIVGPYHRKRKPNTGLKLGSYKYKSK